MTATAARAARRDDPPTRKTLPPAVQLLLLQVGFGVAYYIAARLSLHLSLVGRSVTPLWPPTGIALVGFLWFGYRIAPAVTVAAFLVNWGVGPSAEAAAWIAVGNTLAPAVASGLMRIAGFRPSIDRTRDALVLVVLGALAAMTISATIGSFTLRHFEPAIAAKNFWPTWAVWWAGDAMGILAIAPFLLGLRSIKIRRPIPIARAAEAVVLFGVLLAAVLVITNTQRHFLFASLPPLIWIVWRFGQRGASTAALLVIVTASWAAAHNSGPFSGPDLLPKMITLQVFNAAVALLSFFFAAVVAERTDVRRRLEEAAEEIYQREHFIATTLQQSLLPEDLPQIPDIDVAARYVPAGDEGDVGGDWYDVIQLTDGRLGVAIGDVAGHGVGAAAVMGQLRMALRAYALQGLSPADAVQRLNALTMQIQPGTMATLAFGHIDTDAGVFTVAKAGHPPPLILSENGASTFITGGLGPPLGVNRLATFAETVAELPFGSTLILYTDGLVERRGESLESGLDRLIRVAEGSPRDLQAAGDHLITSLIGAGSADDAAILTLRRLSLAGRQLTMDIPAEPTQLVWMRQVMRRWLRQNGAAETDVGEIVLACTEACSNAIQHAYRAREGRLVIRGTPHPGIVELIVRDFGAWRQVSLTPTDGHGLPLMKGLMDSVSLKSGTDGTEVSMSRHVGTLVDHG
jgi:serine phosphatase RsbU (regulator of sigma subunit)/anti-sigma regulatory factor (Ser/Thr protein kinase)